MLNAKRLVQTSIVLALALAAPAHASWLLGVSAGGQMGLSHTGGDVDEDSFLIGANARMELLSILAAEIAVDYRNESIEGGDISTVPVQLSAMFTLLPFIYLTAGVGWYDIGVDGDLKDQFGEGDLSNTGYHTGAGVGIPLPGPWSFIGDARYIFLNYGEDLENFSQNADYYQLTGGLQYKLF